MFPVSKYYDSTSNIFIAKVLKIKKQTPTSSISNVTVQIVENLKGKLMKKRIFNFVTDSNNNCDFNFNLGKTYLLFSHSVSGNYFVNSCSYSDNIINSKKTIKKLRTLEKLHQF